MKFSTKSAFLLSLAGAAAAGGVDRLLRRRPAHVRFVAAGTAFLIPFGVYALVGDKPRTTFLYITDTHGAASANQALVRAMLREAKVDFVIHGGDIADNEGLWSAWWDVPFALVVQRWHIYAVDGNHDPETGFRQRFPWPPYKLSKKGVDIFFLPWSIGSSIATWLDRETAASTARFRILVTHRPLWSASGEGSNLPAVLSASLPRIDLVLAGHNHVFWDSVHNVGGHAVRQIIEKSGPKNYICNPSAVGCRERSTGFLRVEVYDDRINVERRAGVA